MVTTRRRRAQGEGDQFCLDTASSVFGKPGVFVHLHTERFKHTFRKSHSMTVTPYVQEHNAIEACHTKLAIAGSYV